MLGEQEAMVVEVQPFGLHGVTYYDLAVKLDDGRAEEARLGPESVASGLQAGDRIRIIRAGLMIIQVAREQA